MRLSCFASRAPSAGPSKLKLTGGITTSRPCCITMAKARLLAPTCRSIDPPTSVSTSNPGYSYTCPTGQAGSTVCSTYLAGSRLFVVADYEVFVIKAVQKAPRCP